MCTVLLYFCHCSVNLLHVIGELGRKHVNITVPLLTQGNVILQAIICCLDSSCFQSLNALLIAPAPAFTCFLIGWRIQIFIREKLFGECSYFLHTATPKIIDGGRFL